MTRFRDPGPDDEPTGHARGVWTTRPGPRTATVTSRKTQTKNQAALTKTIATPQVQDALSATGDLPLPGRLLSLRRLKKFFRGLMLLGVVLVALTLAQIAAYRWIAPPTSTLMLWQSFTGTRIERAWRPLEAISPHLSRAVVMSEDAGFCGHRGIDWRELERLYEQSLEGGTTGGGSTLSMQVIKNLFLWPSKSYVRKAIEVPLTLVADQWWGKRRMLEIYLNVAEWGPGVFGAEAAARTYFKKSALELTESEAALLAVALPNPLQRNAADPAPRQRRLATVVQGRMKSGSSNVRCLVRVAG